MLEVAVRLKRRRTKGRKEARAICFLPIDLSTILQPSLSLARSASPDRLIRLDTAPCESVLHEETVRAVVTVGGKRSTRGGGEREEDGDNAHPEPNTSTPVV